MWEHLHFSCSLLSYKRWSLHHNMAKITPIVPKWDHADAGLQLRAMHTVAVWCCGFLGFKISGEETTCLLAACQTPRRAIHCGTLIRGPTLM